MARIPAGQHRVRVPDGLLQSRRHSASAVLAYAVADLLAPGRTAPHATVGCHTGVATHHPDGTRQPAPEPSRRQVHPTRAWWAARVGLSQPGLDDALTALGTAHHGTGLGQTHPVYLQARRYGRAGGGSLAVRTVTACDSYTQVPAWSTGDEHGPLVDAKAWRLYVAAIKHRGRRGVCELPAGDLAEVVRVRRQAVPELLERLRAAGLVVTVSMPRRPTLILPLMVPVDDVGHRAALADEVAEACGYLPAGWRSAWSCNPGSHGPGSRTDLGPETRAPLETQLLQTTLKRHRPGGLPDPPLLADPFPATAAPPEPGRRWLDPPPPLLRHVMAQIAAKSAARRAADSYRTGLTEAG